MSIWSWFQSNKTSPDKVSGNKSGAPSIPRLDVRSSNPLDTRDPRYWRQAKNEVPLSQFIPFSSLISEHDCLMRNGDVMRVWRLGGVPFETNDERFIAERHDALCSLLRNLSGGQFAIWTHRVHRKIEDELAPPNGPPAAVAFDLEYSKKLKSKRFMANELFLTILYRCSSKGMGRALEGGKKSAESVRKAHADAIRIFNEKAGLVARALREFDPELLGDYERNGILYSELAEFLGFLVNGTWRRRPRANLVGPLHHLLPDSRMFFGGDKIEIRDPHGTRYAAVVDIKEYSAIVEPGVMNSLLYEDSEFIETQSFAMIPSKDAVSALKIQRDQLTASDDVVVTQIEAMDLALNNVGDGQYSMGEYHYSLVVFGDDVKDAGKRAAQCVGAMSEGPGIEMVPVDLISDAAWFAQFPGNFAWRPRNAKITSRAFAALAAQHNFYCGKRDRNPWGPCVMMLRTPAGQPYYLNLHVSPEKSDSEDKKMPGNTLILGVTGAGKTTLEMALLFQTQRFSPAPRIVVFDFDRGAEIALRALGGRYYNLQSGVPTGCNPLQREPTPQRIQFWEKLVTKCIENPAMPLMPSDAAAISAAVRTVATFPREKRRFSSIQENLPKGSENSLYHRFARWCAGGALGWVFDEADDKLLDIASAHVIGFDYTQFIDMPEVRTPMLMYLMDVMKEMMDGRRIIYMIAEFWKALGDDVFSDFTKQEQKTIRKKDGLGIFETQSPSDVLGSSIGRTMVEQSVTKICLANPSAVREEYVDGFGLSEAEYDIVLSLGAKGGRQFLVKQGHRSAICEMDLSGLDEQITLLSGSIDNVLLLDEIREQVGDDPSVWIPILLARVQERELANKQMKKHAAAR